MFDWILLLALKSTKKAVGLRYRLLFEVRMKGIEPPRLAAPDPKSGVSTSSTTSAKKVCKYTFFKLLTSFILQFFGLTFLNYFCKKSITKWK